jgi:M6 family metalloprotease-like protein
MVEMARQNVDVMRVGLRHLHDERATGVRQAASSIPRGQTTDKGQVGHMTRNTPPCGGRRRSAGRRLRMGTVIAAAAAIAVTGIPGQQAVAAVSAAADDPPVMTPVDPQNWVNPDDMTWGDYRSVPGKEYNDPSVEGSERQFSAALVLLEFQDEYFSVTKPAHSTIFGNPQSFAHDIPRDQVAQFYEDYLNKPNDVNRGRTMHEYWMEDSDGRIGIDLAAFGPFRLPGKSYEYGLESSMNGGQAHCPEGDTCARSIRNDAYEVWRAAIGAEAAAEFDQVFWMTAGPDESGTWQEFGPMLWQDKEDVPDAWGPPDPDLPNWARTRYVPWTSWQSAARHWPNASSSQQAPSFGQPNSTQAESNGLGTFAHEMSHLLGIADNYNNPFGTPLRRSYTGIWSMLSRGSFNGPGGPHTRWQTPARQGESLGSQHVLRDKMKLGIIDEDQVLRLSREALAQTGLAVVEVQARAVQGEPGSGVVNGVNIAMDADHTPACVVAENPDCPGTGYNNYTLEVNQRIGADTFTPDTGVMISRTKNQDRAPFVWTIDAHPEDIDMVDYYAADGTPVMITYGDYRQLSDALFHAGTDSGSEYEYVDEANRLHFYVVDVDRDADGVVSYTLAVRSLDGTGAQARGVSAAAGTPSATTTEALVARVEGLRDDRTISARTEQKLLLALNRVRVREAKGQFKQGVKDLDYFLQVAGDEVDGAAGEALVAAANEKMVELGGAGAVTCRFPLTNTGEPAANTAGHPEDVAAHLGSDVYRLSVATSGSGWAAQLPNALATAKAGASVDVPVFVTRTSAAARTVSVTLTAVSESDATKTATATCAVAVNPDALTPGR